MSASLPKRWLEKAVDQYCIPTRYPDGIPGSTPDGMPSTAQATQAVASAKQVLQFIAQRLSPP